MYDIRFITKMKINIKTIFSIICLAFLFLSLWSCKEENVKQTQINIPQSDVPKGMVLIQGGKFQMGSQDGMPDESPIHSVEIKPFLMDENEVTVAQFAEFVKQMGYITEAEKFGWSGVFDVEQEGWTKVDGANWRNPEGKNSTANPDEPVCQISWNDAVAFAKWAGKRLPTEAEFEFAARGGLIQNKYSWGNDLRPNGKPVANWWQGEFPTKNTIEDGFLRRANVKSFSPNGFGLYDMAGNVWEWTNDWYEERYYEKSPKENPQGAEKGKEKVIRGGSWMCSENYCSNYRVSGRSRSTPDTGLNNLGFRCVIDINNAKTNP